MTRALGAVLALCVSLVMTGCLSDPRKGAAAPMPMYTPKPPADITKLSYGAADKLISQLGGVLTNEHPIIVATLVNINDLENSSPLGRLVSEQVASRFAQGGFRIIELKLRNKIYMKRSEGELLLTREVRDIAKQHKARAIIAGTYTESAKQVFVNLKLIDLETTLVTAAVDYVLDKDETVRSLLKVGF
jgi:TolB-like protein